ncbi:MAG: hypothetical protein HONBIEJF_02519 [Fimbriimonadaceae bacterium]|nr:hypothetical protein [Fimbriimonadaceae bacterium]
MRLTTRDLRVLRDVALSHALTRDQLIKLGYFGSVTRANTRLRELGREGLVHRLQTPFFNQSIYTVGHKATEVVGERIAKILRRRSPSPRFLQHALLVTDTRIALLSKDGGTWHFEQQLWRQLSSGNQVRPDGLLVSLGATFVELDMGHVDPKKFRTKLLNYQELALSGQCSNLYGFDRFSLTTVTSGKTRARHLNRLTPSDAGYEHKVQTFAEVGVILSNPWS